jgi:hypothetical protein
MLHFLIKKYKFFVASDKKVREMKQGCIEPLYRNRQVNADLKLSSADVEGWPKQSRGRGGAIRRLHATSNHLHCGSSGETQRPLFGQGE